MTGRRESQQADPSRAAGPDVVRVGGGASARIGAIAVAAVLVAVIWVGLANRAPSGGAPRTADPEVAGATGLPPPGVYPSPRLSAGSGTYGTYGISATIGNRRYVEVLDELTPGHLSAALRIPIPVAAPSGSLDMIQLSETAFNGNPIHVEHWALPLGPLRATTRGPEIVIDATVPARSTLRDAPPALRSGFELKVYAENDLLFGIISIEVTLKSVVAT